LVLLCLVLANKTCVCRDAIKRTRSILHAFEKAKSKALALPKRIPKCPSRGHTSTNASKSRVSSICSPKLQSSIDKCRGCHSANNSSVPVTPLPRVSRPPVAMACVMTRDEKQVKTKDFLVHCAWWQSMPKMRVENEIVGKSRV
jgi:hypothetical protein